MKTLTILMYIVISVMIIILCFGLLLPSPNDSVDRFGYFIGAVTLLILAAALPLFFWKEEHPPELTYICISGIMLMSAVQMTGGGMKTPFFPVYFLFLMWVSLPSVNGPSIALGLGMGIIEGFAPIARRLAGSESLYGDVDIFINFIIVFLSLFGFGLGAAWLTKTDFSFLPERGGTASRAKIKPKTASSFPTSVASHFLPILHQNSCAAATCLFVKYDKQSYQLVATAGSREQIISKYMLPVEDPMIQRVLALKRSCLFNIRSNTEHSVSALYRNRGKNDISLITVTPVFYSDEMTGFFLQDFVVGTEPDKAVFKHLDSAAAACVCVMSGKTETADELSVAAWTEELVEIVGRGGIDTLVTDVSLHLTRYMKGATISILEADLSKETLHVWVKKGPLSKGRRRKRTFSIHDGIAGWCVRNASPCTQMHLKQGRKKIYSFTKADDPYDETNSCLAVPIMDNGSVIGLIMAEHNRDDYFTSEHSYLVKTAAGMLSIGLSCLSLKTYRDDIKGKDTMTGLPGVTRLQAYLGNLIKKVQKSGSYIGLLIADIDDFSQLNLKHGYTEGNRILQEAARRFRSCLNHDIFIAKTGPDSFAACIPGAELRDLEALASRIVNNLTWEHKTLSGDLCTVSVSIGASFTHTDRKVLILLAEAEKAVAKAKGQEHSAFYVIAVKAFGETLSKRSFPDA